MEEIINQLPEDWNVVKLGDIGRIETGSTPSKNNADYYGKDFPFFKPSDLKQGINTTFASDNLSKFGFEKARRLPKNSTLVTCIGATIGKTGLIKVDGASNQQINSIIPNNQYNPKFVYYQVISKSFQDQIKNRASATTLPILNKSKFRQLNFITTRLATQQAIVSKIEELFSELDKGVENLLLAQQQLKTYRQSVLKWAFEGRLTNENVKDGELPKGWKLLPLKDVSEMNPKIPDRENISNKMEVQFLPMKLVEAIINKIDLTEIRKYEEVLKGSYTPFIDGDVIFAKVTPCMENGKIAIVDKLKNGIGFGSSEFHVIRASNKIIGKYIFYYLVQDRFRNEAANEMTGAVGLRRVPKQFIENYDIPLPTIEEQNKIIQAIERRLSVADKMEESITQSLQQAEALRQSILKKAFEGNLT